MVDIHTSEPSSVIAGDTLSWQKSLASYPASAGWTLHYRLINAETHLDIPSSANGEAHLINIPAATSAAYAPGIYSWQSYVTNIGGERYTIQTGKIEINPDWTALSLLDTRSIARQILDALEAAWVSASAKRAFVWEYKIAGRQMKFATRVEWIAELDYWRREVAKEERAEKIAAGLDSGRKVYVRF
jgi:hypothetical protein